MHAGGAGQLPLGQYEGYTADHTCAIAEQSEPSCVVIEVSCVTLLRWMADRGILEGWVGYTAATVQPPKSPQQSMLCP